MDINKERVEFEQLPAVAKPIKTNDVWWSEVHSDYFGSDHELDCWIDGAWAVWQAKAQAVLECTWVKNEDGYFDASCGQSFVFSEPEDKPSSHEFTHCCFCGGKLIEAQEPTND